MSLTMRLILALIGLTMATWAFLTPGWQPAESFLGGALMAPAVIWLMDRRR
jgi:hypothetical protein